MSRVRQHPLTGGLASVGGLVAGLGVGLLVGEPAAGGLTGVGLGLVITALLRAHGLWLLSTPLRDGEDAD